MKDPILKAWCIWQWELPVSTVDSLLAASDALKRPAVNWGDPPHPVVGFRLTEFSSVHLRSATKRFALLTRPYLLASSQHPAEADRFALLTGKVAAMWPIMAVLIVALLTRPVNIPKSSVVVRVSALFANACTVRGQTTSG